MSINFRQLTDTMTEKCGMAFCNALPRSINKRFEYRKWFPRQAESEYLVNIFVGLVTSFIVGAAYS